MTTAALIVAAGQGTRATGAVPKQYAQLGAVPMLARTRGVFLEHPAVVAEIDRRVYQAQAKWSRERDRLEAEAQERAAKAARDTRLEAEGEFRELAEQRGREAEAARRDLERYTVLWLDEPWMKSPVIWYPTLPSHRFIIGCGAWLSDGLPVSHHGSSKRESSV